MFSNCNSRCVTRVIDDIMIRRFLDNVFNNTRARHAAVKAPFKNVFIKRRLNTIEIRMFFSYYTLSKQTRQLEFLIGFSERILRELFGVRVTIETMEFNPARDVLKNRKRKYELGTQWEPVSK